LREFGGTRVSTRRRRIAETNPSEDAQFFKKKTYKRSTLNQTAADFSSMNYVKKEKNG
jgi:hypothetical protein